jgi:phosphoesterase RecJ-like protein
MIDLHEILKDVKTVAIGGHMRPDGDCVGSTTGLYQYIREYYPDIEAELYLEETPHTFDFLKAVPEIRHEVEPDKSHDVFFMLDCSDSARLGFSQDCMKRAKYTVCIDHHVTNLAFANENYIEPEASSTSELVYNLLDTEKITRDIAESLYLGMVHDTGVFQYSCTAPSTMLAAAELMKKGIDFTSIIENTFYKKTYVQNQILGRALLESIRFMDGKCIFSIITRSMMEFYGVQPKHLDGIVNQLRVTTGVEVAIFMYELEKGEYKVSLRANGDTDVSKVAGFFGGGGHKKAAGFSSRGNPRDILNNLAAQLEKAMKEAGV